MKPILLFLLKTLCVIIIGHIILPATGLICLIMWDASYFDCLKMLNKLFEKN